MKKIRSKKSRDTVPLKEQKSGESSTFTYVFFLCGKATKVAGNKARNMAENVAWPEEVLSGRGFR